VRHATQEDLDRIEALLAELRKIRELLERKRGYFSRGSRAFLHFHEDAGDLYADVKLDGPFQRMGSPAPASRLISSPRYTGRSPGSSRRPRPRSELTPPGQPGIA